MEHAFEFLIQAPRIVKEVAPMTWTYLQGPADGSVFMEWQPAGGGMGGGPGGQRPSRFASDGFVWADAESAFTLDVKGYVSASVFFYPFFSVGRTIAYHLSILEVLVDWGLRERAHC